jgi:hypothetical protein
MDKLKATIGVREDLQKKKDSSMEEPYLSVASMRMHMLLISDAEMHKARIFQRGAIGALLQARFRGTVYITLSKIYEEALPRFN